MDVSEIFPHIAQCVDDIALVRSMRALSNNHAPATMMMMTGTLQPGRPCVGSWGIYGLGTENQNLPAFVVLLDKTGGPLGGPQNWSAGFIPGVYQGTPFRNQGDPIVDLASPEFVTDTHQRQRLGFIRKLNEMHLEANQQESELAARIASYELAYRMQSHAPEAVDLSSESEATRRLYGLDEETTEHFGRNCLLARRLVERNVRFVEVYCGSGSGWDAHQDMEGNHGKWCKVSDKPIAGLLQDLEARGLLDETLVVWGGEFGRTPFNEKGDGRDHNPWGFTIWMAGAGIKPGISYGETDDHSYNIVKDPVHVHDLNATILHTLGIDHTQLTFKYQGRHHRLTDVHGKVVEGILKG
jgi:hypothetical protein